MKTKLKQFTALTAALALCSTLTSFYVSADAPSGSPPDKPSGEPDGSSSTPTSWDADLTYTASDNNSEDTAYSPSVSSTSADYNAILNSGGTIWLSDVTASRTGSSSSGGDSASFYGIGAAILTTDGTTYIDGAEITTTDKGGAGIFSYNNGTTYVRNAEISTTSNTAGGIHAAGGGTLYAYNVNATSAGQSSAALRSDRGGGTMVVEGGSYTSNGTRSPAVYCTADITVADSVLTSTASEAVCIEGMNSLALFNCDLSGDAPTESENSNLTWGIILYQSMSGDSSVGNSDFYMQGGTLNCTANGDTSTLFFNTNTESTITLNNVEIDTSADYDYFLLVSGFSRWGTTGSNGADCLFTAVEQEIDGNIGWDTLSEVDFYLTDGSVLTGAVVNDNTFGQSESGSGYCNLYLDDSSEWVCTGNSTVTNLYNAGGTIKDESGNTVTIVQNGNTVVSGNSAYTVTVTGTYSESDNTANATKASSYSYIPYSSWNPWSDGGTVQESTEVSQDPTEEETQPSETTSETQEPTEETPPEKPDGTKPTGETPPEKPDGTEPTGETPSAKPEDDTTVPSYGDVDENGTIDILDVITLNKALLGKEELSQQGVLNADVNQSGTPDSSDSLNIMKYIVGLVTEFPV
ncbi:MAG: hypothetical protein II944_01785 [Ruminobacter sp.]|nr:hypothetical protein [Ruminobacter sp.]